jgi:hypothetical protein
MSGAEAPTEITGDPLHIGNTIAIVSEAYGLTVGRVTYRDADMVRVIPQEASDRAVEFPMTEDGTTFAPELGVSTIEIIEEQASDHFVDTLGARPGDVLEFFTVAGDEAAAEGVVDEVIKTDTKDAIRLTDGRMLKFRGRGPPAPIAVIRVRSAANVAAAEAEGAAAAPTDAAAALARQTDILALLRGVLPAATAEVVPTAERSFPDSMQREDMFQDLLAEVSAKQKTNPRRIRAIEREVDLAVALKNNALIRDEAGRVAGLAPYDIRTLADVQRDAKAPVPVMVPIVRAARVLNLDEVQPEGTAAVAYKATDVAPRQLLAVEQESEALAESYLTGAEPDDPGLRGRLTRGFYAFTYDLLSRDGATLVGDRPIEWAQDQDVIRTAGLGEAVQGLGAELPRPDDKEAPPVSLAHLMSDVTDRYMRVLAPNKTTNLKTGTEYVAAPSDPSEILGYVILPPKAAITLRPPTRPGDLPTALLYSAASQDDNLPTITQALHDLYSPDRGSALNAWTLPAADAGDATIADWLNSVLKYAVHPADSLGPRSAALLSLLDTIGVNQMSVSVATVIRRWVAKSQKQWREILSAHRKTVQASLDAEAERRFFSVTGDDSPLWPALREAEPLRDFIADIDRRNPAIGGAATLLTGTFLAEAQGDAAPLVWATVASLDGRAIGIDAVSAANSLAASRAAQLKRKALRDIALLTMRAEPEISTCPHTARLEAIRNLRDVLQRSRLLREFIEEYQGGRQGEWVTCTLCRAPCVCYHELMELEALAQPARMDAIQKQILIRFGGERYEGKIVCKNCGQGLQDIDYDEHVEFDDDGRPIQQGSVLTDEQMAEDNGDTRFDKAVAKLVAPTVVFETASQRDLGNALQTIIERAGMVVPADTIRMIVRYADLYASARTPPAAAYETQRARAMTAASTKIRTATGAAAATIDIPTYAALVDQIRVSALTALTAIALQVADPPVVVNNPFPLCPFSREGWPLNPAAKLDEPGALVYISCVVASIQRDMTPWVNMSWAAEPKLDTRRKAVFKAASTAAQLMVVGDPKTGPLSFTPELRGLLQKAQTDTEAATKRALVSHSDELPAGFRPEPFPVKVGRPAVERDPLPAIRGALESGSAVDPAVFVDVAGAIRQQSVAVVSELHAAASAGMGRRETNTVDNVCCPVAIRDAEAGALQGATESVPLLEARRLLRGAVPTAVNAGTHMWPLMETPVSAPVSQIVDPDVFFKLFLKYCYRGAQVGETHEFSAGNVCRQCGFALGKPFDTVDFTKEGAAILAAQQGDLRVEVTNGAFDALSDAVRRRRIIRERARVERQPWAAGLQALVGLLEAMSVGQPAESGIHRARAALAESLGGAVAAAAAAAPVDAVGRATIWMPVDALSDELREVILDRIGPLVPRAPGRVGEARAREATMAMTMFETLTADPFVESPRAIQEYWCAKPEAAARGFKITEMPRLIATTTGQRQPIAPAHRQRLSGLLRDNAEWYAAGMTDPSRKVIGNLAKVLGPMMRLWLERVRPAQTEREREGGSWTQAEAQLVLRLLILQAWADVVTPNSWMYGELATAAERDTVAAELANWTRGLMFHVKQQFIRFSDEQIRQVLQQRSALERASIVKEFEDVKDEDEQAAMRMTKILGIGRWAIGAKNLRKYDPEILEHEEAQRARMGIVETAVEVVRLEGAGAAEDFGFALAGGPEDGYDVNQAAAGDDY